MSRARAVVRGWDGPRLDLEPVLPPAFQMEAWRKDMLCDTCRQACSIVWKRDNGERVRRCEKCEEGK
jgi:hypothetical protein